MTLPIWHRCCADAPTVRRVARRNSGQIASARSTNGTASYSRRPRKQDFAKEQMAIYELDGVRPQIHETAWIAESAEVIGNVHIGADYGIWPGVGIRGDNEPIRIGDGSNIQDNWCCIPTSTCRSRSAAGDR